MRVPKSERIPVPTRKSVSGSTDIVVMKYSGFSVNDIEKPFITVSHLCDKTAGPQLIKAFFRSEIIVFPICTIKGFSCLFRFESAMIYKEIMYISFT